MFIFQGDEKAKIQASVDENIRKIKEYEYEDTIHTLEKKECTANPKYQSKDNIEDKHITIEVQMTEKEAAKKIMNEYGEAKRGNNLEKVQTSLIGSKPWHPTNIKSDTESLKIGITNVPTLSEAVLNMFVGTENQRSQNNEVVNYFEDLIIPDSLYSSDKPTAIVKPCKKIDVKYVKTEGEISNKDDSIKELLDDSNTNYSTINQQEIESKEFNKE